MPRLVKMKLNRSGHFEQIECISKQLNDKRQQYVKIKRKIVCSQGMLLIKSYIYEQKFWRGKNIIIFYLFYFHFLFLYLSILLYLLFGLRWDPASSAAGILSKNKTIPVVTAI